MIKWFAYIVLLLIFAPCISSANANINSGSSAPFISNIKLILLSHEMVLADTTVSKNKKHQQEEDEKQKIKEVAKAKRQAKPAEVVDGTQAPKPKPKRQRRPEGMERPPEIPRRNGN